jgi:prepilin-type N-terminal cleavage/methylation domain-containing protein/prepilin-type processing-associated H-X9-DG protein
VPAAKRGFTLIELLVVVAIIALLISILLPSLAGARKQTRAIKCAANLRQVAQAMACYLAENLAVYPPSYIYASNRTGSYDLDAQPETPVNGYLHWSWFLYNRGKVGDDAFTCPEFPNRGTPRTNPGPEQSNWESQQDVEGGTSATPASLEDRQAARLAFTGNAAIFPRNKFNREINGGKPRINRLVNESEIKQPGGVILATEFNNNWRTIAVAVSGDQYLVSKSHRPVNPFYALFSGSDEYAVPDRTESFTYTALDSPTRPYGLLPKNICDTSMGLIDSPAEAETNAVGRHHPGGDKLGGMVNFLFADGHVVRKTILQTLKDREWGEKYYALTGNTKVIDRYGDIR